MRNWTGLELLFSKGFVLTIESSIGAACGLAEETDIMIFGTTYSENKEEGLRTLHGKASQKRQRRNWGLRSGKEAS